MDICRILIKFNKNLNKKHVFKEHTLLTFNALTIIKDQLHSFKTLNFNS